MLHLLKDIKEDWILNGGLKEDLLLIENVVFMYDTIEFLRT